MLRYNYARRHNKVVSLRSIYLYIIKLVGKLPISQYHKWSYSG